MIKDFADGLEYQLQVSFQDRRFLKTLQKEGAGLFRLEENCLSCERRFNSSREASPTTWESSTANAMFIEHVYEQMKRNQIKLRFLVTYIAPTRYIQ